LEDLEAERGIFFVIIDLFDYVFNSSDYITSNNRMVIKMNWKGYGRKRSRLNLRWCYPNVYQEEMRKIKKILNQYSRSAAEICTGNLTSTRKE
jgi:hypothetical protein